MGRGLPQRWQLRSPGGLATAQAGLAHRLGGPSGSAAAPSAWIMKPQSMHATAPSSSADPHAGQLVGVVGGAPLVGPGVGGAGGGGAGAALGCTLGTPNGFLHDGHPTCFPAAWSGTCI